ncbi:neuropeptides capa receptor-like [Amphiura filiformis]|uniref:neuropeptides capa receptor-like n=1 Tax=Amphiura filiformis TaxID=82378 RepID=UPI003B21DA04
MASGADGDFELMTSDRPGPGYVEVNNTKLSNTSDTPSNVINIDSANAPMMLYSPTDKVLVTVIMPMIFTIGVLGNAAIIIAFFKCKYMRTVTNHYLVSLAFADMTFLLFAAPQFWIQYFTSPLVADSTYMSLVYCKLGYYFTDTGILASGLTVIIVTVERYLGTCWPFKFRRFSSKRRTIMICISLWIACAIYKIPVLYFGTKVKYSLTWDVDPIGLPPHMRPQSVQYCNYCFPKSEPNCNRYRKSLSFDQIILLSVIPLTCILYTLIVVELRRSANAKIIAEDKNAIRTKKQVVRMLIVTIALYAICITPFRVLNLFDIFGYNIPPKFIWILVNISRIMMYINSATNPFIYNVMSDKCRRAFRECFCFCIPGCEATRQFGTVSSARQVRMSRSTMRTALDNPDSDHNKANV